MHSVAARRDRRGDPPPRRRDRPPPPDRPDRRARRLRRRAGRDAARASAACPAWDAPPPAVFATSWRCACRRARWAFRCRSSPRSSTIRRSPSGRARVPPPWVLKPRSSAAAIGIKKVGDRDALWRALDAAGDERSQCVLEQFVPGDVYHVDSIVWGGQVVFAVAVQVRTAADGDRAPGRPVHHPPPARRLAGRRARCSR